MAGPTPAIRANISRSRTGSLARIHTQRARLSEPRTIVTDHPGIGGVAAHTISNPILAQPCALDALAAGLGLSRPGDVGIAPREIQLQEHLRAAFTYLDAEDDASAALAFRAARKEVKRIRQPALETDAPVPDMYALAILGDLTHGIPGPASFRAALALKEQALRAGQHHLVARERLARAQALLKIGQDESALEVLEHCAHNTHGGLDANLAVLGFVTYVNVLLNRAKQYTREHRDAALETLRGILVDDLSKFFGEDSPVATDIRPVVAALYRHVAEVSTTHGLHRTALEIFDTATTLFAAQIARTEAGAHQARKDEQIISEILAEVHRRSSPEVAEVAAVDEPDRPSYTVVVNSPLIALLLHRTQQETRSLGRSYWQRCVAGTTEFFANMTLPSHARASGHLFGGAVGGAIVGSAVALLSGQTDLMDAAVLGSGIGAAGLLGTATVHAGVRAAATQQAWETGYSTQRLIPNLGKQIGKLIATYAVFGGHLPAEVLQFLPEAMTQASHLGGEYVQGPGSLIGNLVAHATGHLHDLSTAVSLDSWHGVGTWWNHWVSQPDAYFVKTLNNHLEMVRHPGRLLNVFSLKNIPAWMSPFQTNAWYDYPLDLVKGAGYLTAGFSGLYSVYRLSQLPRLVKWATGKEATFSKETEMKLVPGSLMAAWLGTMVTGSRPFDAAVITGLGLGSWYLRHTQTGGDPRVFRRSIRRTANWAGAMNTGPIFLMYFSAWQALKVGIDIPAFTTDHNVMRYIGDYSEFSYGALPLLTLLGIPHAWMFGLNVGKLLVTKILRGGSTDVVINNLRNMLPGGQAAWPGQVASTLSKEWMGSGAEKAGLTSSGADAQRGAILGRVTEARGPLARAQRRRDAMREQRARRTKRFAHVGEAVALARQRALVVYYEAARAILDGQIPTVYALLMRRPDIAHEESEGGKPLDAEARRQVEVAHMTDVVRAFVDLYFLHDFHMTRIGGRPQSRNYQDILYRALINTNTPDSVVQAYLDQLALVLADNDASKEELRYQLLVTTVRAAAEPAHGATLREFFTTGRGKIAVERFGKLFTKPEHVDAESVTTTDGENPDGESHAITGSAEKNPADVAEAFKEFTAMLDVALEDNVVTHRWRRLSFARFFRTYAPQEPHARAYRAMVDAASRWRFNPFAAESVVEGLAPIFAAVAWFSHGEPARPTTAEPGFYHDTLYRMLMLPSRKFPRGTTTETYVRDTLVPTLDVIKEGVLRNIGGLRVDADRNLLLAVLLAARGPYSEAIQHFVHENIELFRIYGFGADLLEPAPGSLPTEYVSTSRAFFARGERRRQRLLAEALFTTHLRNSTVSADGVIRHQAPRISSGEATLRANLVQLAPVANSAMVVGGE